MGNGQYSTLSRSSAAELHSGAMTHDFFHGGFNNLLDENVQCFYPRTHQDLPATTLPCITGPAFFVPLKPVLQAISKRLHCPAATSGEWRIRISGGQSSDYAEHDRRHSADG